MLFTVFGKIISVVTHRAAEIEFSRSPLREAAICRRTSPHRLLVDGYPGAMLRRAAEGRSARRAVGNPCCRQPAYPRLTLAPG
jgi:hypothetical protein